MPRERLKPKHIGDGVYVHDLDHSIVIAVNHHDNKVVSLEGSEMVGLMKYAQAMGMINKFDLDD